MINPSTQFTVQEIHQILGEFELSSRAWMRECQRLDDLVHQLEAEIASLKGGSENGHHPADIATTEVI